MAPLNIGFFGNDKTTLQLDAELMSHNFEISGTRIAFDHRALLKLQAGKRLDCKVRISIPREADEYLFDRFVTANFEMKGKQFNLIVAESFLRLRVDYETVDTLSHWSLEEHGVDLTQAVMIDRTISYLDRIRGAQTRFPRGPFVGPSIPCYLRVTIDVRDPPRMDVADRIEPVEDKAVVSTGRPESNRRKF